MYVRSRLDSVAITKIQYQEETTVVGRITLDTDSQANSRLTETTMSLESSRMLASGARIPLRFDQNLKIRGGPSGVGSIGLFPGAIVALRGKNGGGGWFLVTEILSVRATRLPGDIIFMRSPVTLFNAVFILTWYDGL